MMFELLYLNNQMINNKTQFDTMMRNLAKCPPILEPFVLWNLNNINNDKLTIQQRVITLNQDKENSKSNESA